MKDEAQYTSSKKNENNWHVTHWEWERIKCICCQRSSVRDIKFPPMTHFLKSLCMWDKDLFSSVSSDVKDNHAQLDGRKCTKTLMAVNTEVNVLLQECVIRTNIEQAFVILKVEHVQIFKMLIQIYLFIIIVLLNLIMILPWQQTLSLLQNNIRRWTQKSLECFTPSGRRRRPKHKMSTSSLRSSAALTTANVFISCPHVSRPRMVSEKLPWRRNACFCSQRDSRASWKLQSSETYRLNIFYSDISFWKFLLCCYCKSYHPFLGGKDGLCPLSSCPYSQSSDQDF